MITREAVRRAYQNVLRREPDESGCRHYMQSASSQEEVEGYLRQSSEFLQLEVFSAGKKNKNVRWPLSQIFVDINHKIGYCPIGKVGNSTLKEMFIGFSNIDNKEMILYRTSVIRLS